MFLKDNAVIQDFTRNTISLLDGKCTVPATTHESLLPIAPAQSMSTLPLITLKEKQIVLPGDTMVIEVDVPDQ